MTPAKRAQPESRRRAAVHEPPRRYEALPSYWEASAQPVRETPLLLDTHVWLWVLDGTTKALSAAVTRLVDHAAHRRELYVSDFSFWEVAMLAAKGRLELAGDVSAWLDRAAEAPGVQIIPVSRVVLVQSTLLPGDPHGDPVDRILLAQAQSLGASLLTCDRGIAAFAKRTPGLPVCDGRR